MKESLHNNDGWNKTWSNPQIKKKYDVIIIGGGGHGLATAFYLAKEFNIKNIAVLEKKWIGGGNVGRNTTIIRSNYLLNQNEAFYEFSLKLWENLEKEINYNAMVSQRGVLNVFHSDAQRDSFIRRGNGMILNGADAELFDIDKIKSEAENVAQGAIDAFRETEEYISKKSGFYFDIKLRLKRPIYLSQ